MRFNDSVLAIDVEAVRNVQGDDALSGLWNVFTKCKNSLKEGPRLENIAWRLWHKELYPPPPHDATQQLPARLAVPTQASRHKQSILSSLDTLALSHPSDGDEEATLVESSPLSPDPSISSSSHMTMPRTSSATTAASEHMDVSPLMLVAQRSLSQPNTSAASVLSAAPSSLILEAHHRTCSAPNTLSADPASAASATGVSAPFIGSHSGLVSGSQYPLPDVIDLRNDGALSPEPQQPRPRARRASSNIGQVISTILPDKVHLMPRNPGPILHAPAPLVHSSTEPAGGSDGQADLVHPPTTTTSFLPIPQAPSISSASSSSAISISSSSPLSSLSSSSSSAATPPSADEFWFAVRRGAYENANDYPYAHSARTNGQPHVRANVSNRMGTDANPVDERSGLPSGSMDRSGAAAEAAAGVAEQPQEREPNESESGAATPRAPTSPTRQRSPIASVSSTPRPSAYAHPLAHAGDAYQYAYVETATPGASTSTSGSAPALSISEQAAEDTEELQPSYPTLTLTNPTPRPTPPVTPKYPRSPARSRAGSRADSFSFARPVVLPLTSSRPSETSIAKEPEVSRFGGTDVPDPPLVQAAEESSSSDSDIRMRGMRDRAPVLQRSATQAHVPGYFFQQQAGQGGGEGSNSTAAGARDRRSGSGSSGGGPNTGRVAQRLMVVPFRLTPEEESADAASPSPVTTPGTGPGDRDRSFSPAPSAAAAATAEFWARHGVAPAYGYGTSSSLSSSSVIPPASSSQPVPAPSLAHPAYYEREVYYAGSPIATDAPRPGPFAGLLSARERDRMAAVARRATSGSAAQIQRRRDESARPTPRLLASPFGPAAMVEEDRSPTPPTNQGRSSPAPQPRRARAFTTTIASPGTTIYPSHPTVGQKPSTPSTPGSPAHENGDSSLRRPNKPTRRASISQPAPVPLTSNATANTSNSGAPAADAKKIFFIQRSPPGEDRFIDPDAEESSASSGGMGSFSIMGGLTMNIQRRASPAPGFVAAANAGRNERQGQPAVEKEVPTEPEVLKDASKVASRPIPPSPLRSERTLEMPPVTSAPATAPSPVASAVFVPPRPAQNVGGFGITSRQTVRKDSLSPHQPGTARSFNIPTLPFVDVPSVPTAARDSSDPAVSAEEEVKHAISSPAAAPGNDLQVASEAAAVASASAGTSTEEKRPSSRRASLSAPLAAKGKEKLQSGVESLTPLSQLQQPAATEATPAPSSSAQADETDSAAAQTRRISTSSPLPPPSVTAVHPPPVSKPSVAPPADSSTDAPGVTSRETTAAPTEMGPPTTSSTNDVKKAPRANIPKSHSHTSLHKKGRNFAGLARIVKAQQSHERGSSTDSTAAGGPSGARAARGKIARQVSGGSTTSVASAQKDEVHAEMPPPKSKPTKRVSLPPEPEVVREREPSDATSPPVRPGAHSRSPSANLAGSHRSYISSPLSSGAIVAPRPQPSSSLAKETMTLPPLVEPVIEPSPPKASQPARAAAKRPPMPGRAHTSATIVRPPATSSHSGSSRHHHQSSGSSHAMKQSNSHSQSKSPGKRSSGHHAAALAKVAALAEAASKRKDEGSSKKKPIVDVTSSDFETTSEEGSEEGSSMWSSDDEGEAEDVAPRAARGQGHAQQQHRAPAARQQQQPRQHHYQEPVAPAPAPPRAKGKGKAHHQPANGQDIGELAREAALEAARQRDMFRKVPSRSYSSLGLQRQTGLLTPLLNPDPRLVPYLPGNAGLVGNGANAGGLGRPHNSAQNLGRRMPVGRLAALQPMTSAAPTVATSPTPASMLKPSKSAAEVRVVPLSVTSTQVAVNPSGQAGYRPRGRPEDEDLESDDEDDGEDDNGNPLDVDGMSKSMAQRKLEQLAGLRMAKTTAQQNQSKRSSQPPPQRQQQQHPAPGPSQKDLTRSKEPSRRQPYPSPDAASFVPEQQPPHQPSRAPVNDSYFHHGHASDVRSSELQRTPSLPVTLPHPYNLPAPAPPSSPLTTRRQMMYTEISESLRRNLLWERDVTRKQMMPFTRMRTPAATTAGAGPSAEGEPPTQAQQQAMAQSQVQEQQRRARSSAALNRTKSWADDYHQSGW